MPPESPFPTEDAVKTVNGLLTILSPLHATMTPEDAIALHDPVGFLLNAMHRELHRARKGNELGYSAFYQARRIDERPKMQ